MNKRMLQVDLKEIGHVFINSTDYCLQFFTSDYSVISVLFTAERSTSFVYLILHKFISHELNF